MDDQKTMSRLIAIDPGVRHLGVAVFDDGRLTQANLYKTQDLPLMDLVYDEIVIEKPQVYPKSPGDPNDLIDLAIVVGRIVGQYDDGGNRFTFYKPSQWKGQTPKPVHHERIRAELERQGTLSCVEIPRAKSLAHNIYDAVGLGLFHIKKTKGRRKTMSVLPELVRLQSTLDDAAGMVDRLAEFESVPVAEYEEEIERAQNNLIKLRGKLKTRLAAAEQCALRSL